MKRILVDKELELVNAEIESYKKFEEINIKHTQNPSDSQLQKENEIAKRNWDDAKKALRESKGLQ
jgi:hypothetical protein